MRLGTLLRLSDHLVIDHPDYLRTQLCIASLYTAVTLLLIVLVISLVSRTYHVAFVISISLLLTLGVLADYYRYHNPSRMSNAIIGLLYLFLLPLPLLTINHDHTLIWTLFFPLFAIIVKGGRSGLLHTAGFYTILFSANFLGLNPAWSSEGLLHFVPATLAFTLLIYCFKVIYEQVHEKLIELLRREKMESKTLQEITTTDPLTGLKNRRTLQKTFTNELNRAKRHGHCLGFFVLDIDHFKRYNDQLGQKMGDRALQMIANILQAGMRRSGDHSFRLGGEEFAGLMVVERRDEVIPQVERLRQAVEAMEISYPYEGEQVGLTLSAGVLITDGDGFESADDICTAAESALYGAKREGRNRVVLFRGG
ncbi:MAG: GGDEF domain-containing protein [Sedimenticola sp.]